MKINFIIPFTNLTGGIKVVFEYCNRLKDLGHEINIYVPMKAYKFNNSGFIGILKTLKASVGNTFIRGTKVNWFNLNCKIKLVPYIRDRYIEDADICIATAWPTAYDVNNLSISKGKKVYFIQHYEAWSGEKDEVDNSYKLDLEHIVIAKWLQELMLDKFKKESTIIYNGIDKSEFLYNDKRVMDNITICILYHKLEWKGFLDGIKAIDKVKKRYPNIRVLAFGTERGEDIPDYVEFYEKPSRQKIKEIYSDSDIYVFPSKKEGWGLTVIEAMACKCAVVGTNTGALLEVGVDGENCLISHPEDINALNNNIIKLIEDASMRNYIAKNGYNLALEFEYENSVEKMEQFFRKLLG